MPRATKKSKATPEKETPTPSEIQSTADADYALLEGMGEELEEPEVAFPTTLPVLPIRDQVYFPHMMFPLLVGREKSVRALEEASAQDRHILIVAQRNIHAEDPEPDDIFSVGIVVEIMQVLRVPDGTVRVMLVGWSAAEL